jgi:type I restriction enzyme S subunit
MSEWKEYILEEVTEPVKQTYNPDGSSDFSYIGLEHIEQETLRLNSIGLSSDVTSNKFKFKPNDVLFGKLRPYFRKVVQPKFGGICSTDIWVFRAKEDFDQKFLFYFLANWDFVNTANHGESGTRMPRADWNFLKSTEWVLPPLPEQAAIAEVLSSLDDKIDLLHRQNKTLEQLAETLFRQWFVEEAEESWEIAKLGDIAVVQNGYAFSSKDYVPFEEGHLEVLKMGHIAPGGGLRTNPKKDFVPRENKLSRWVLKKGDIIMAMTDMKDNVVILGVPAMIDKSEKYVLNQRVARIYLQSNEKLINNYLLYIQLNNKEFIATLQSKANSGVQVNLSTEAIKNCEILIPPSELQKEYGIKITELYYKKELNDTQIRTLTQLRDTLLPKLMSREIRLNLDLQDEQMNKIMRAEKKTDKHHVNPQKSNPANP